MAVCGVELHQDRGTGQNRDARAVLGITGFAFINHDYFFYVFTCYLMLHFADINIGDSRSLSLSMHTTMSLINSFTIYNSLFSPLTTNSNISTKLYKTGTLIFPIPKVKMTNVSGFSLCFIQITLTIIFTTPVKKQTQYKVQGCVFSVYTVYFQL